MIFRPRYGLELIAADSDTGIIDPPSIGQWIEDLGVSSEGVFMYYILWKAEASSTMQITKEEFIRCMNNLGSEFHLLLLSS